MRSPWFVIHSGLAIALLLAFTGCPPAHRQARHLAAAEEYRAAGNLDHAEIEYRNVLQLAPAHAGAIAGLGLLYFEQGRISRALPYLERARDLAPGRLDVRTRLGLAYFAAARPADARTEAAVVLASQPTDEDALVLLVESARTPAEVTETRRRLEELTVSGPPVAAVSLARGILEFRAGRMGEAESAFAAARTLAPRSSAVQAALALLHQAREDLPAAEAAFAAAAESAPARSPRRLHYAQFKIRQGDLAAAERILTQVTEATPDYVPAWTWRAELAAAARNFPQCEKLLEKVLARDRAQPDALLLRIRVRLAQGQLAAARQEADALAALYPQSAPVHYQRALTSLAAGELDSAAEALRQAVALAPQYADAILLRAEIEMRRGGFVRAVAPLRALVERRPDLLRARQLLADALRGAGDPDGALEICRKIAADFPQLPEGPWLIGLALERRQQRAEARAAYARALAIAPGHLPTLEQLVALDLAEQQPAAAADRVAARLAADPPSAGLHLLAARICLARDDPAGAEAALQRALAIQPDLAAAYFLLARLQLAARQPTEALASLQAIVARNPLDVAARMLIAVIQDQLGDYAAARATYETIIAQRPRFGPALNNLACLQAERLGNLDAAFALAQRARALHPDEPHSADTLGWILYQKQQYAWAAVLLQESAARLPGEAIIAFHAGLAHYMMGEEAPARRALARALELSPDFSGAAEARQRLALLDLPAGPTTPADRARVEKLTAGRPQDPIALSRRGALYEGTGDLAGASAAYAAALALNPASIPVLVSLARVAARRGESAAAMEWAKTARKLAPGDPAVVRILGRLAFAAGDHPWAASLLDEIRRRESAPPDLLEEFAQAAYRAGRVTEAEAALRQALESGTDFPQADRARSFLELIEISRHGPAAAAAAATRIQQQLQADPDCAAAAVAWAVAGEGLPDQAESRRRYEDVLRRYPHFTPALRPLVLGAADEEFDSPATLALAEQARSALPDDPALARALGMMLYRQGEFRRAVSLLQAAAQGSDPDARLWYYLGMAHLRLRQPALAGPLLRRALELPLPPNLAQEARRALGPPDAEVSPPATPTEPPDHHR
jgi:Flp pilus assembly protein TadD